MTYLIFLTTMASQITAQCTMVKDEEDVNQELQKLGFQINLATPISYSTSYVGLNMFENENFNLQVAEYDLTDKVLNSNFEFRKNYFSRSGDISHFPYKTNCLQNNTHGYFIFTQTKKYETFQRCLKRNSLNADFLKGYLRELGKIFKSYEADNMVIVSFNPFNFGCSTDESSAPLFGNLNMIYGKNDPMYIKETRNKLIAKDKNQIFLGKDRLQAFQSIATPAWSAFSLISAIEVYTYQVLSLYLRKKIHEDSSDAIFRLYEKCNDYLNMFQEGELRDLKLSQVEKIVDIIDEKEQDSNLLPETKMQSGIMLLEQLLSDKKDF